jgi:hypothetical protein
MVKLTKIIQNRDNVEHVCENCIFYKGETPLNSNCLIKENNTNIKDFLDCEPDGKDYIFILE